MKKQVRLGAMIHGVGGGWDDWRHPDSLPNASTNFEFYKEQAQAAEAGKFDFAFIADSLSINANSSPHYLNRIEPLTMLGALAAVTNRIGLVATITVSYSEPFTVARQLGSLDHISKGRAGWNVVTSWLSGTADNYNKKALPPHDERYEIAREHVAVVQGLWDSWEDDAFIYNKETGQFFDKDKLHTLNHEGKYFSVKGPLNTARSPQGQPVIFQAGKSEEGRKFSSETANVIFAGYGGFDEVREYTQDIKRRAREIGRNPDEIYVMPGVLPIIGDTQEEADAKYRELTDLIMMDKALHALGRPFDDHDFTQYDLDAPFPDVEELGKNSHQGMSGDILRWVREENLTLREVAKRHALPITEFIGTPEKIADLMEYWVENGAADGFIIQHATPKDIPLFVEKVVPLLQAKGVLREDYTGTTLREHLNIPFKENRYTKQRAAVQIEG